MKRMCALLLALLLALGAPALADSRIDNRELYSLEEALTALLDVYIATGEGHPTDGAVESDYAASYLYALANAFYGGQAVEVPELADGNFDRFVKWDGDYVNGLLFRAFGPAFGVEELGETAAVRKWNGDCYVAIGEGGFSRVSYAGATFGEVDDAAQYPFHYIYAPADGKAVRGALTVYLDTDPDTGWAYVAAFSVDRDF